MQIIDYFESSEQTALAQRIAACDWSAARFLAKLLQNNTFYETLGGWGRLFLLMNGDDLVSFSTLSAQDSIQDASMTPWIGFVFTQPQYRGCHYAGRLLAHAEKVAYAMGFFKVYLGTDHVGLYEKYGFSHLEDRIDCWGDVTRVMYKDLA